ncbi:hypothetical protein BD410DRAFT_549348 [Rickenella mellea]|uniref:F-box domain-containing protein n=1 Tax=Rickenella mellea TaxID=50990 RepID=A0A4Y7PR29_9AGAM|nr:hypothetical protein BD410DRAFT_549348 [Rickenella mellea]
MFESVQNGALKLISAPFLVHSDIVSATTCLRDLFEAYNVSTTNDDIKDKAKLDAMVATLREFRALRDHLRPILDAAETTLGALEEICLPHIRKCGINSLPDELIRRIFEVGCGPHDVPLPYFDIPMELSHVCRRFRSIALTLHVSGLSCATGNLFISWRCIWSAQRPRISVYGSFPARQKDSTQI